MFNRTKTHITLDERKELYQREITVLEKKLAIVNEEIRKTSGKVDLFRGMEGGSRTNSWSLEEDVLLTSKLAELVKFKGLEHPNKFRDILVSNMIKAKLLNRSLKGAQSRVHKLFKSIYGHGAPCVLVLPAQRIAAIKLELSK